MLIRSRIVCVTSPPNQCYPYLTEDRDPCSHQRVPVILQKNPRSLSKSICSPLFLFFSSSPLSSSSSPLSRPQPHAVASTGPSDPHPPPAPSLQCRLPPPHTAPGTLLPPPHVRIVLTTLPAANWSSSPTMRCSVLPCMPHLAILDAAQHGARRVPHA